MAFDAEDDILQDFLVEAGELLESLSEQLVELERRPDDSNLLNAIFRGFHTVKGGAGFLSLTPLVEVCHGAENIFDLLRNGKCQVTSDLMDVVLQALDAINSMFEQVKMREEPSPADPRILQMLDDLAHGRQVQAAPVAVTAPPKAAPAARDTDEITDDEFDNLLEQLTAQPAAKAKAPAAAQTDEITDDEFESLLDELHGKGRHQGKPDAAAAPSSASDLINDDEFEALLDQLHGKGQGPTQNKAVAKAAASELINDAEFEALLDQLHGKGQGPTSIAKAKAALAAKVEAAKAPAQTGGSDLINDQEFEALLDQLHGQGKGPTAAKAAAKAPAKAASVSAAPAPAPVAAKSVATPGAKAADDDEHKAAAADTTVRVDTKRLDDIMNMVGELVLVRNRLITLGSTLNNEELAKAVGNLDVVTADLQGAVMKTRMQPIKKVFGRFPRVVRDLARSLRKEVVLELRGEETDLDKNLVEALADPLVHLVRNSVDHGIEEPDKREMAGKPRTGTVTLSAAQEGDHILLSIADDGAGMDANVLRRKAVEKGMMEADAAERLTEIECYNLIFAPGFSTRDQISDISGRGVGMDVVKTKIAQLNGSIHIDSRLGKGSSFVIKVPLTLAILPTLMVIVGKQTFALPLGSVNEIFHLDLRKTNSVDGQQTIMIRDKALPLFYLDKWLVRTGGAGQKKDGHVVIVQVGTQQIGFVVDGLVGQEEVVIKPLGSLLHGTPGMAGATITSDGNIALILDVPNMLKHYARRN